MKKPQILTMNLLHRKGAFLNMTPGHALVFRFCDDIEKGQQPEKEDIEAIVYALKAILTVNGNTDEIMAEVARRLQLTKDRGQKRTAQKATLRNAELVAGYLSLVKQKVDSGVQQKTAEIEARSIYCQKLGIGDRAMRNKIRAHKALAEAILI